MTNNVSSYQNISNFETAKSIIDALRPWTNDFPEAAVKAAIAQKEKITPLLIALLEETLQALSKAH